MIEDKNLGLKVAENEEEMFWTNFKENREKEIKDAERSILINKAILKFVETKLKK